ncbi:2-nitropropane dioxygenase [Mycobacterium sp. 852002-10029_SCH5224772]|nr:2-nitropropane dioxygenase [Mycobacterium sp. 852002-10029_SCH5224772]
MAGGPSTPELAAAVTNAGGLGFLAAGMLSAEGLADAIVAARKLTGGALGVNLFVPQEQVATTEGLDAFAAALAPEAQQYGVALGEPRHDDDEWAAKLEVVCDLRPEVVSFTFGAPSDDLCRRLAGVGTSSFATLTTVGEAVIAIGSGVDALVAQGPAAGGHRATFDALVAPPRDPLEDMVTALAACCDCPVVAAGGIGTPRHVRRMRDAGATAVQVGTALLLADEAGTNPTHRAALCDPQFTHTTVTRAFTGRYARALHNRFIDQHEADAIFGFPEVARVTAPIQAAAVKLGDPHGTAMWAGAAFHHVKPGSAVDLIREFAV